jgi:HD-like signal output (HDOD) protein
MAHNQLDILADLKVHRLPSLPHVLVDMLQACQGNKVSFQELSSIISRDAAIASRVVLLANSSFYSRGTKINSLERALLVLGTDTIKTIVITASIQQFFSGFNSGHTEYLKSFWKRSLTCALMAKSLAILTSYPNPDEAYLTGLMHNIGELVLETNYSEDFNALLQQCPQDNERCVREKQLFSVNHADVGAWLVKEWGLNDLMADAIEFHHAPNSTVLDAHHLVKIVYLASKLSDTEPQSIQGNFECAEQLFELNASLVSEIIGKISAEVISIASSLGIKLDIEQEPQDDSSQTDEHKQVELAKQIRNIGLLQTAAAELNRASSKQELGRSFQSTLDLLFGYSHSAVFWYEEESNELSFIMPEHPDSVPIKFKCEPERSIIAQSALKQEILCSVEQSTSPEELPVVDQQIIRVVGSKGIICIPIFCEQKLFCVLAAGSDCGLNNKVGQHNLLKYFADEIALTCEKTLSKISRSENNLNVNELTLRVSELVHEANNPLNIINNYLATLAHKLGDDSDIQEELKVLKEEVERTGHILLRLKDLQHSSIDQEPGVEINDEINSLVKLYKSSLFLSHDINCELDLAPELQRNNANRNSFRQILTNLLRNSVEAMKDGGTISIKTTDNVNVNGRDFAEIVIQDNGPGIPAEILKGLFSPVTSTKGSGHSGLGLSITKNLVTEAQGTISCRSNQNGTSFQILLPMISSGTNSL